MARWTPAPIVGGAYSDDTAAWNHQDTVNYIPVQTERPNGRSDWKLVSAPGFYMVADTGSKAPIRGMRNVEGTLLVVSGNKLYKVSPKFVVTAIGTIPGVLRVSMAHNQVAGGNQVAISNGQSGYVYSTVDNSLVQITDDGFPGASSFDFVDGYITGIDPGRNFAFTSDLADAVAYSELDRYQAEGSPDKLVGQIVDHREWWLFGERTIEPFQNTGSATGTFQRSGGTVIDVGAASTHAIVKMDNSVFWLGSDDVVYRANGYTPVRISTFPIEQAIARSTTSSAFAFTFEDRGHKIFYLTFLDGQTWGYDVATQEWHRRESRGLGRWRINDLVQWNGMWIGGDFSNGKLYRLDWNAMEEDGEVMERRRVTGVLHDSQNAVIVNALALVLDTGLPSVPTTFRVSGDLPDGESGTSVNMTYQSAGGVPRYAYTVHTGRFPDGLTLEGSGHASGTRTTPGSFDWVVQSVDSNGVRSLLRDTAVTTSPPLPPTTGDMQVLGYWNNDNHVDSQPYQIGQWLFAAAEVDRVSGFNRLRVNGVTQGEATYALGAGVTEEDICVGNSTWHDPVLLGFCGLISGAAVINGLLSDADMAFLYNGGDGRSLESLKSSSIWDRVVFAWPLDDIEGSAHYADLKGNIPLTREGEIDSFVDPKFGRVAYFAPDKAPGLLRAYDSYNVPDDPRTYIAWFYPQKSNFDFNELNKVVIGSYDGTSDGKGLFSVMEPANL